MTQHDQGNGHNPSRYQTKHRHTRAGYLTAGEAMRRLKLPRSTFYDYVKRGIIPRTAEGYPEKDIDRLTKEFGKGAPSLSSQTQQACPQASHPEGTLPPSSSHHTERTPPMSLLSELQLMHSKPEVYGASGPLGLKSPYQRRANRPVIEELADMMAYALLPQNTQEGEEAKQRWYRLLLGTEIAVPIYSYPVYQTPETKAALAQGILGVIFLVERNEEGAETKRTLWKQIVCYSEEEKEEL